MQDMAVVICGGGPTGALLSALLGQMEIPNIVLEREPDINTDPRGIVLDEDGIRILQSIGVYDQVYTRIGSSMGKFHFVTGDGTDLYKKPLASIDNSTSEGGTGHVGFLCQKQPALEKTIREAIEKCPYSQLRSQVTVQNISEDENHVYTEYREADGQIKRIRSSFLVGADGKTGFVRKKYLEAKGVVMEQCEGTTYNETWVALNWKITLPTPETHPEFALWKKGYTPEEVYDLFFPTDFRFLCNPNRPAVCGRFGLREDRLWRFEFVVHKDEDGHAMAKTEATSKIILPYLTHPGSRYSLKDPVRFPEDCITTLRSRPFSFSARSCNKWSLGRVILAGDAAHVFPPFGGQGISSGFRDAAGLAWRLALLHRNKEVDHQRLLAAWYLERKQQLERSLATTIRNGEYVTETRWTSILYREWYLWFVQMIPSWKRQIEKGPRGDGMIRYQHKDGLPFMPGMHGGLLLPQVYAWSLKEDRVIFSDDLIFDNAKKSLFQLVLLPDSVEEIQDLLEATRNVTKRSGGLVRSEELTILLQSTDPVQTSTEASFRDSQAKIARVATGDEFAADTLLCNNRPYPKYYDPHQLRKELKGMKIVVVRPDRFVYAACTDTDRLTSALDALPSALCMNKPQCHL